MTHRKHEAQKPFPAARMSWGLLGLSLFLVLFGLGVLYLRKPETFDFLALPWLAAVAIVAVLLQSVVLRARLSP